MERTKSSTRTLVTVIHELTQISTRSAQFSYVEINNQSISRGSGPGYTKPGGAFIGWMVLNWIDPMTHHAYLQGVAAFRVSTSPVVDNGAEPITSHVLMLPSWVALSKG